MSHLPTDSTEHAGADMSPGWIEEAGAPVEYADDPERDGAADAQITELSFRTAIERAVRAGLAACDLGGRQTYVNEAFCDLLGWSEAELVGAMPPFHYWPAEEVERIEDAFRITLAGEAPEDGFELRFQRKDGRLIDVLVAVAPLVADDGSVQGWLASVSDISQQKEVQAALRSSERQLMFTLESARVGTWDWDMVTGEVRWSDNLEAVHGMQPGSFGSDFDSFLADVRPDHRDRVLRVLDDTIAVGSEYQIEYPVEPKSGRTIWVEGRGRVIRDEQGRPIRMAGICMDITDRKLAEAEVQRLNADLKDRVEDLRHAERRLRDLNETLEARVDARTKELAEANERLKSEVAERTRTEVDLERVNYELRRSNRELQDFVYVASHDLKEPLRKIAYLVDLLKLDAGKRLETSATKYVDRIQASALRMTHLIDDLLTYSYLRNREQPFEEVDLRAVVRDVLADLALSLQESGGEVEVGELTSLQGDPTQLRQLFQNLIANSLKFRRDGVAPVVHVRCASAELRGRLACRITVEDNGIGFEEKYAHRIFVPFQRLHEREMFAGSGIGLAICRRIVERHRGEITARSRPGEGASFSILLPLRQEDPAASTLMEP